MFWRQQIQDLNDRIKQSSQKISDYLETCASLFNHFQLNGEKLPDYFDNLLKDNYQSIQTYLQQQPAEIIEGWQSSRWQTWKISNNSLGSLKHLQLIRVGQFVEKRLTNHQLCIPEFVPFIG